MVSEYESMLSKRKIMNQPHKVYLKTRYLVAGLKNRNKRTPTTANTGPTDELKTRNMFSSAGGAFRNSTELGSKL